MNDIPKGQPRKPRDKSRPVEQVFGSKMESAYGNWVSLFGKVKVLARHRALKSETSGETSAENLNRFIERMTAELAKYVVKPGAISEAVEEKPLSEFLEED